MKKPILKTIIIIGMVAAVMAHMGIEKAEAANKIYIDKATLISYTEEIGQLYGICPEFLQAMAEKESSLKIKATNDNCKGLMQINTQYHEERMERLGVTDIYDPYGNILVAADYLAELFQETEDPYYVLMRYNMKTSTANKLYNQEQYSDYAVEICERAAELERSHGK